MMTSLIKYRKLPVIIFLLLLSAKQNAGLMCYECDSTDLSCQFQLWTVQSKECATNVTHCYTEFAHNDADTTQLRRGCGKPESCAYEGSQICATCSTDNCNTHNICYYIMCGTEQADCRSANFQHSGSRREVCQEKAECITKLDMAAHQIERRCTTAADASSCSDPGVLCVTCNTPYCNTEQLLRCLSSMDPDEPYCYGKKCFEKIDNSTGDIVRGCYPTKDVLTEDYKICSNDDCNDDFIFAM